MEFRLFKDAVAKQFSCMNTHALFRTDVERDALWDAYINAFPRSNPIFRVRTENDCSLLPPFHQGHGERSGVDRGEDGKHLGL